MFIVGGTNTFPSEIENVIGALDEVAQVHVVGIPDERLGEVGMAFVELLTESGRRLAQSMFAPLLPLLERASAEPDTPEPQSMAHCLERIAEMINSLADEAATS